MRKSIRKLLSLALSLCLLAGLLPLPAASAADGPTVRVSTETEFRRVLESATDGMTIQLTADFTVSNPASDDAPLAIGKQITIDGGSHELTLWYGGIILGADVTLRNLTLSLPSSTYYSIYANGHTLTLENVQQTSNTSPISLFCGSLERTGFFTPPEQGAHGTVVVKGTTRLLGNIYAGSEFPRLDNHPTNEPASYHGPSSIIIESSANRHLGTVYACGAAKVGTGIPAPTADPAAYPVSGPVNVQLYHNVCPAVDGNAGDGNLASVTFHGKSIAAMPELSHISSFSVESGMVQPTDLPEDIPIFIKSDARLDLSELDSSFTVGNFNGGGELVLGETQTLTINGAVSGSTKLAIGSFQYDGSSGPATPGHPYIRALQETEKDFTFIPNSTQSYLALEYADGSWNINGEAPATPDFLVESLDIYGSKAEIDGDEIVIPLKATFLADENIITSISYVPLKIWVNGISADMEDNAGYEYTVTSLGLSLFITGDNIDDYLVLASGDALPAPGIYQITLAVPSEYSTSGQEFSVSTILTVEGEQVETLPIAVPEAVANLIANGNEQVGVPEGFGYRISGNFGTAAGRYTAIAILDDSTKYRWDDDEDGDTREIPWSIAEAETPEPDKPEEQPAPSGLTGEEPESANGNGKIMGTTEEMEYATSKTATNWTPCDDGTTSVPPGTYYVRYAANKDENLTESPASEVVVPVYSGSSSEPIVPEAPVGVTGEAPDSADGTGRLLGTTADMEYALAADPLVWLPCAAGATPVQPGTYYVRYTAVPDDKLAPSSTATITVSPFGVEVEVYPVTVHGSHASISGSGSYPADTSVRIDAGSYLNHIFAGWLTEDVTLDDPKSAQTTFIMPGHAVELTAEWTAVAPDIPEEPDRPDPPVEPDPPAEPETPEQPDNTPSRPSRRASSNSSGSQNSSSSDSPDTSAPVPPEEPAAPTDPTSSWRSPFGDVPTTEWYYSAVAYVCGNGLMSGTGSGSFAPEAPMTRSQLVSILYRLAGSPAVSGALPFPDADADAYYADAVRWAVQNGITSGYSNGNFGPEDPINNEQLCTLFYRFAQQHGADTAAAADVLTRFTDRDEISSYAVQAFSWAADQGILTGNSHGQLAPQNTSTRAQAAAILMRYQLNQE